MSNDEPGPTHSPYGQPDPYGQSPQSSPYGSAPTGQPYGQQPAYGSGHSQEPRRRPGTVTAGAWIAIVFSGLTGLLFAGISLLALVARDSVIDELQRQPDYQNLDVDINDAYGVGVAMIFGIALWCLIAVVLAVFVLRRSNVARILLVISSGVTAAFSLLGITSGISIVWLAAAIATIVLLFVGDAGNWFKGLPPGGGQGVGGYQAYGQQQYGSGQYGAGQYGQQQYGAQPTQPYPSSGEQPSAGSGFEPYGQQQGNPYGQQPPSAGESGGETSGGTGSSDYPPKDYPGR
ncbi:hypothetical protein EUA93_09120 [Nocardioides oleivorans]|uniref:DUF4064 domain-containing protein n=1 Tax=Nocardioides oleivorans TaxID=273676 RepID=A0A4Q2RYX3_9ACTN|nr:hypothetical protein [Nocardioides oleivorans]RYB94490.1 hypothetical protein EUA93_09120 [Nocardioides oleivorans]